MRASAELDNLIEAGQNFRTRPDGAYGHKHIRAVGGFSYFDVIFKVGNEYFKGTINIENNAKGARFMSSFLLFSICAIYYTLSFCFLNLRNLLYLIRLSGRCPIVVISIV